MMEKPAETKKPGAFVLFALWGLLRFYLIARVRHLIRQNLTITGPHAILLNHCLIVFEALCLFAVYAVFRKLHQIDRIELFGEARKAFGWGAFVGIGLFLFTVPVVIYFGMSYSPQFSAADAVGNIFSNGAEELIYRGILFMAAMKLFSNQKLAVVVSAAAFGLGHWDMPFLFQGYVMVVGMILGWSYIHTKGLAAPYVAHMTVDLLIDSLFH